MHDINPTPHPGAYISEMVLRPFSLTRYRLAKDLGISQTRLTEILEGRRALTADTALRLEAFSGIGAEFWLTAQMSFDLARLRGELKRELSEIQPYNPTK